jgi:hypothetical protein
MLGGTWHQSEAIGGQSVLEASITAGPRACQGAFSPEMVSLPPLANLADCRYENTQEQHGPDHQPEQHFEDHERYFHPDLQDLHQRKSHWSSPQSPSGPSGLNSALGKPIS